MWHGDGILTNFPALPPITHTTNHYHRGHNVLIAHVLANNPSIAASRNEGHLVNRGLDHNCSDIIIV